MKKMNFEQMEKISGGKIKEPIACGIAVIGAVAAIFGFLPGLLEMGAAVTCLLSNMSEK